jgi:hypothetical protein
MDGRMSLDPLVGRVEYGRPRVLNTLHVAQIWKKVARSVIIVVDLASIVSAVATWKMIGGSFE